MTRSVVLIVFYGCVLIAGVAGVASRVLGLPLWAAIGLGVVAVLVNGVIAAIEDDLPRGWNNPDGRATPEDPGGVSNVLRWVAAVFCFFLAAVSTWVAPHYRHMAERLTGFGVAALCLAFGLLMIRKRRWALAGAILGVVSFVGAAIW